jgi:signal transduction histidine kinase
MIFPQIPANERERLNELYKYEILDSAYEEEFDEIVRHASNVCNVPMSLITLIDFDRLWYKAQFGIDGTEAARNTSFCAHAILSDDLLEVEDATADMRFFDNPFVLGEPKVRFYAGMPLTTQSGYKIGTLCIIDNTAKRLTADQVFALKVLSRQIVKLFELRVTNKELNRVKDVQQKVMTIMAHDIRGSLASMKATYDLKNDFHLSEAELEAFYKLIPQQLGGTLQLLNDIVTWGKMQVEDTQSAVTVFHPYDTCDACFSQISVAANSKGNTLINKIAADLKSTGHKEAFEFILRNLIGNANKFTSGGTITVSGIAVKDGIKVTIADTGKGMSDAALKSLKQSDWAVTEQGTHREKGSGLGLRLIYEFLSAVNGSINFDSAPGAGTKVEVYFPNLATK